MGPWLLLLVGLVLILLVARAYGLGLDPGLCPVGPVPVGRVPVLVFGSCGR